MEKVLTLQNFESTVSSPELTVVDFWATWCGPCKMIAPIIEEIANENPDLFVGSVDVDMEPMLAARFQIRSIPTVILLKDGKVVKQFIGAQSKETYQKAVAEL